MLRLAGDGGDRCASLGSEVDCDRVRGELEIETLRVGSRVA